MLKRSIVVLTLAGGLLGAQGALAYGHQATGSEEASGFRSYLDGQLASEINATHAYSDESRERGRSDSSPFPWDNSRD
jgi:hypothetical protein